MRLTATIAIASGILFGTSCSRTTAPTGTQQATVVLRAGGSFAGTVTKASSTEITLQAPNGESRTYPMSQVDSVQYAQSQTVAATAPPVNTAPVSPAPANPAPVMSNPAPAPAASAPPVSNAVPPPADNPPPMAPATITRTVPAGTTIEVRNNERIDSKTASTGQTYSAVIARDISDRDGRVAIPRGSDATLIVRSAEDQGRIQGRSELSLDIDSVRVNGRRYRVETEDRVERGKEGLGTNKRTGVFTGGGAALGTLLGAIAGGGKGAAIGAISGAAAGTATQAVTRGKGVYVPPETVMTFRLEAPIRITEIR